MNYYEFLDYFNLDNSQLEKAEKAISYSCCSPEKPFISDNELQNIKNNQLFFIKSKLIHDVFRKNLDVMTIEFSKVNNINIDVEFFHRKDLYLEFLEQIEIRKSKKTYNILSSEFYIDYKKEKTRL